MAKIEIYETDQDVKREALKTRISRADGLERLSALIGIYSGAVALSGNWFDKMGWLRVKENGSRFSQALEKHWIAGHAAIAGVFAVLGISAAVFKSLDQRKLDALGPEECQQVLVPDTLSCEALGAIPIRPVGEQKLHKVPAEKLKSHTQRLLDAVNTPSEKSVS